MSNWIIKVMLYMFFLLTLAVNVSSSLAGPTMTGEGTNTQNVSNDCTKVALKYSNHHHLSKLRKVQRMTIDHPSNKDWANYTLC